MEGFVYKGNVKTVDSFDSFDLFDYVIINFERFYLTKAY